MPVFPLVGSMIVPPGRMSPSRSAASIMARPAVRALRARHAGAGVTAVVGEPLRALVELAGVAHVTAALESADTALLFGGERLPPWLDGRPFVYSWLGGGDDEMRARVAA